MKIIPTAIIAILLVSSFAFAWDDCPFGLVNDTAPGECGRYVDTNGDGLCDHSEQAPLAENNDIEQSGQQINIIGRYNFIPIVAILAILYAISFFALKNRIVLHRKIWNILLLISFIFVAVTSIMIVLQLEYGLSLPNTNFLHIETGLIMIIISILHILWHLAYFKSVLKLKK
jgi:hypothetical protein